MSVFFCHEFGQIDDEMKKKRSLDSVRFKTYVVRCTVYTSLILLFASLHFKHTFNIMVCMPSKAFISHLSPFVSCEECYCNWTIVVRCINN